MWGFVAYSARVIAWLKKYFISHEGKNHRPYILCKNNIRSIIVVVLFLELVVFLIPTLTLASINITGQVANILPADLSMLTNGERQARNLRTLTVNPILNQAAEMKAKDMATKGYFAHVSPDGKTPWYWLKQAGYKYEYAGENLAVDPIDSRDVINAWMASPTHRENIVKRDYTEMGTGIAYGVFQGRTTIFVAQVYANSIGATKTQPQVVIQEVIANGETPPEAMDTTVDILGAEKFSFVSFLRSNSRGNEVMELQKLLNALGHNSGSVDGTFGPRTKSAVVKFQLASSLKGDGVVGPLTRAVLNT